MATARENGNLRPLPDYLWRGLKLVFVGFNPGVQSALQGHYYAHPRNHFWSLLYQSGIVPHRLGCEDDKRLWEFGIGLTDLVERPTRGAEGIKPEEFAKGSRLLKRKLQRYRPLVVAFNGKGVFEKFSGRRCALGEQGELFQGVRAFVLPGTSPRNRMARDKKLDYFRQLARCLRRLSISA